MISSGQPVNEYIDGAVRHVMLRQGVLGIKVGLCSKLYVCSAVHCRAAQQ
jgi:ribosomal protein S3